MNFDLEKHYKELIRDLAELFNTSISKIHQDETHIPDETTADENEIVYYKNRPRPKWDDDLFLKEDDF